MKLTQNRLGWLTSIVLAVLVGCTPGAESSGEKDPNMLSSAEGEKSGEQSIEPEGEEPEGEENVAGDGEASTDAAAADAGDGEAAAAEEPAAEVPLVVLDYEGLMALIESHQGTVVVVDVWSTSCPPCLREFPNLVDLSEAYEETDVACISVSVDYTGASNRTPEDYRERVMRVLTGFGATFENVLASEGSDEMLAKLGVVAPPAVYVYDRSGTLVERFDNEGISGPEEEFTYDDINALVAALVSAEAVEAAE